VVAAVVAASPATVEAAVSAAGSALAAAAAGPAPTVSAIRAPEETAASAFSLFARGEPMIWLDTVVEWHAQKGGRGEVGGYLASLGHPELIDDEAVWNVGVVGAALAVAGIGGPRSLSSNPYQFHGARLAAPRKGALVSYGPDKRIAFVHSVGGGFITLIGGGAAGSIDLSMWKMKDIETCRWPMSAGRPVVMIPREVAVDVAAPSPTAPSTSAPPDAPPAEPDWSVPPLEALEAPLVTELPLPPEPPIEVHPIPAIRPAEQKVEWSIADLLEKAGEPDVAPEVAPDGAALREAAIHMVDRAVTEATKEGPGEQIRYEIAMQATNGSERSLSMLADEAKQRGMQAKELARSIVAARRQKESSVLKIGRISIETIGEIQRGKPEDAEKVAQAGIERMKREIGDDAVDGRRDHEVGASGATGVR
jgi:hypothetical protein